MDAPPPADDPHDDGMIAICGSCAAQLSKRASACPACGAPTAYVWAGQVLDVVFGALLSYVIYEYATILLEMVNGFNTFKAQLLTDVAITWETFFLPMRFFILTIMTLYIVYDVGDVKKRIVWFPQHQDAQYLGQVLIVGLYGLSVALGAKGHFGAAFPFAWAVFFGGYGSYMTACTCEDNKDRRFFAAESSVQASGATIALLLWSYYTVTREHDKMTPMYAILFAGWMLGLMILGQAFPQQGDDSDLTSRCQLRFAFPRGVISWAILQLKKPLGLENGGAK